MFRRADLVDVLAEFARTMATDFPIHAILDHLVERIVELLPITAAGVTLISAGRHPQQMSASDELAMRCEQLQTQLGEGPCLTAFETGEAVVVPDLSVNTQFPTYGPLAIEAGLVAAFTFPLRHGDDVLGALDLYRDTPGTLGAAEMEAAQTLADVTTAYLLNAQARQDVSDAADRHRERSLHDALTGLPNRVLLHERLEHAASRARGSHNNMAILFIDLDGFKRVNDRYGHQSGDEVLVAVAARLRSVVRPGDTVARMAGDEFVVLCEDLERSELADVLAQRVVATLAAPFELAHSQVSVTASVGIAFAGRADQVPEQVLNDADAAMYQAKRAGGARHQLIDLRERERFDRGETLERDLRRAAVRGELRLDYQPLVRTADARITGVEALLRWDHPQLGPIPPSTMIPLAEQSDLILSIGRWVLEQACTDLNRLQAATGAVDLEMAVNVSPHQLMTQGWCRGVGAVLDATGTNPASLTIEVTESVYVEDSDRALVVLTDVKELGVGIALDDFGTGYSSLGYLQRFPIDIVKIDRRFIAQLDRQPVSAAIVGAIIDLAHILDQTVVAEGVETAEQHALLAGLECDSCQGFYFARPMPIADLERHVRAEGATSSQAVLEACAD